MRSRTDADTCAAGRAKRPPRGFLDRVRSAGLPRRPGGRTPVGDADIAALPAAAQRYLRFMGVVERPLDWSFRGHLTGRFRRGPEQAWMPCEAWQYNSGLDAARLFWMRIRVAGLVPMTGWDTYQDGHGRMHGKLLNLVTVADGSGPEFDVSELVTYLNDAVLIAPSMLLGLDTTWTAVGGDDGSFDVALTDRGRTVTARVMVDGDGAPLDFSTTDRYADLAGGLVRARWSTPVTGWRTVTGRPLITGASAVWHLPAGPFCYAELALDPDGVAFNIAPDD